MIAIVDYVVSLRRARSDAAAAKPVIEEYLDEVSFRNTVGWGSATVDQLARIDAVTLRVLDVAVASPGAAAALADFGLEFIRELDEASANSAGLGSQ